MVEKNGNVRLRRVNVKSWGSAVSKQCKIRLLPTLWLYDGQTLVSKDRAEILKAIDQ